MCSNISFVQIEKRVNKCIDKVFSKDTFRFIRTYFSILIHLGSWPGLWGEQ